MLICRVLVGRTCSGNRWMRECPIGYDSTTDGSKIFVVYTNKFCRNMLLLIKKNTILTKTSLLVIAAKHLLQNSVLYSNILDANHFQIIDRPFKSKHGVPVFTPINNHFETPHVTFSIKLK
jgi:hypothetical protein